MSDTMIEALLRERAGYDRRGDQERVRQVDEQLAHYGYEQPQGRTSTGGQQTAEGEPGEKRGRGRPKLPRDAEGNVIRE